MLLIVGTVPDENFPLTVGPALLDGTDLVVNGIRVPVNRGTPALIGAVLKAALLLGDMEIQVALVGDIGTGKGSRDLYGHLVRHIGEMKPATLAFHYLQPDVDWHNKILFAIEEMKNRPILIADAGFMYAAKMSGQAGEATRCSRPTPGSWPSWRTRPRPTRSTRSGLHPPGREPGYRTLLTVHTSTKMPVATCWSKAVWII